MTDFDKGNSLYINVYYAYNTKPSELITPQMYHSINCISILLKKFNSM